MQESRRRMEFDEYRKRYFVDPAPEQRFAFAGFQGVALFFQEFEAAVAYYTDALGPPGYVEGAGTRGWRVGTGWLTLLRGTSGHPTNVEVIVATDTAEEAERLHTAFVEAGGTGEAPSDQLMYEPVRYCPVVDPFGTHILIISPLR